MAIQPIERDNKEILELREFKMDIEGAYKNALQDIRDDRKSEDVLNNIMVDLAFYLGKKREDLPDMVGG